MLVIVGLIQYQPDVYSSSKFDSVGVILTRRSCLFFKAEFCEPKNTIPPITGGERSKHEISSFKQRRNQY